MIKIILWNDRKIKLYKIADILKISKVNVENIFHEHLDMNKLKVACTPNRSKILTCNNFTVMFRLIKCDKKIFLVD